MKKTKPAFSSFTEFWPYYLKQHSKPATRWIHAGGTLAALALAVGAVLAGRYGWLPLALAVGYLPAWPAHYFIQKNKPATFVHPFWSFCADFRMAGLILYEIFTRNAGSTQNQSDRRKFFKNLRREP